MIGMTLGHTQVLRSSGWQGSSFPGAGKSELGCRSQGSSTRLGRLQEGPASGGGSQMPGGGGQRDLSTGASDSGVSDLL